jgi:isoleucyl-tRNA synthetase
MRSLPAELNLPAIDHEILARWRKEGVFEASLRQTEGGPRWTFYEGPPTANGMPGIHHVEARVIKDMFCRYKTMQGFHVRRKAGWDCHGLPVEVAVEMELGLSGKPDIESYGVAEFNKRCRESVLRHVDAFAALTERMGYWIDLSDAYRTMDAGYVESVWWALTEIYDKGLLVRDLRISPYCPRCGTALSDHEMGQPGVYREVTDPAVTVRFRVTGVPQAADPQLRKQLLGADLLVWTTTPWTLPANTAVAVHPDVRYVVARKSGDGDKVVVAESLYARVLGEGWHVTADCLGSQLLGATYREPFGIVRIPDAHLIVAGEFVTTEDGTGLVHLAPAFGTDDMAAARAAGLPVVNPVRADGRFAEGLPLVGGLFFKDADQPLMADLAERRLLFQSSAHAHPYPHCWRCGTVLLYYAVPSWFIRTTAVKGELLAQNAATRWQPPGIRDGRYGSWLRGNVDWALSRTRYWGTPLPLWECAAGHVTSVASVAALGALAGRDLSSLDPHRPYVDVVTFPCPSCGEVASRVPEVIDAWFDAGAMPFAQHGAPWRGSESFAAAYPAQFICEAIDQTRGWFYALMAVGTLVFGRSAYESVVCLGHVVDEQGRKMSKHLGNVMEPMGVLNAHGADAVRWFFAASGSPWEPRRIGPGVLDEITRKVLATYWNTVSFLTLHASPHPASAAPGHEAAGHPDRPALDRWLLSEVQSCVADVTAAMDAFDSAAAGRRIAGLIDDLSNWYVRRSRRRLRAGPPDADSAATTDAATTDRASALATLHSALVTVTKLMAPIAPFLADYAWDVIRPPGAPSSVHLAEWPAVAAGPVDLELSAQMAMVRRLVELGRSARAAGGVGTRQPLSRAVVGAAGFDELPGPLRALIAEELNVHDLSALETKTAPAATGPAAGGPIIRYSVKPQFRALGKRFGAQTPAVAAAIRAADPAAVAAAVADGGSFAIAVPGPAPEGSPEPVPSPEPADSSGEVWIAADEVIVTQSPASGWEVATADGETVALDLNVTPSLRAEGLAREVIRRVQQARKSDGLAVTDRIMLRWSALPAAGDSGTARGPDGARAPGSELASALAAHGETIAAEVLAVSLERMPSPGAAAPLAGDGTPGQWSEHGDPDLGLRFWIRRQA